MPLTTEQAATRLGIKPSRVRQLCIASVLVATKHGRDWDIDEASVERYAVSDRKRGPKGPPKE